MTQALSKLNVAFIGGGINSAVGTAHRSAIEMDRRYQLVAGCFSRDGKINHATAAHYNVDSDRVYPSLSTLIEKESSNLDAVIILTPTPHHMSDIATSLNNGIPVICEKALVTSSEDAVNIENLIKEKNGFLAVTFNYTGYPMVRELKSLIKQGDLGTIEQVHIEMPQEGFARHNQKDNPVIPQEWRLHDEALPTISLDLGVHVHHLIDYLTGERPTEVVAEQNSFGSFKQIVDNTNCIAKYTNNLICNIWFSKVALGRRNGLRVRIYGDKGAAEWYQLEPEDLHYFDNKGRRMILDRANVDASISNQLRYNRFKAGHPAGFIEAFANHYYDIADALEHFKLSGKQTSTEHVFGVEKAKQGLIMLEAITKSSNTHQWVPIDE